MLSQRLKQLRLARGLSLRALADEMGGLVTKQALSKYELGQAQPSAPVLGRLAAALGVKAAMLFGEPPANVRFLAYRKKSRLSKAEQERIESVVAQALEDRVRLQDLVELSDGWDGASVPVKALAVSTLEEAEEAASTIRERWNLGTDPIGSVVDTLEENFVHVIALDTDQQFDGLSAVAERDGDVAAAAVITRLGVPGGRERLNLTHELGHLVLTVADTVDEEGAAFRFGAAFLAPAETFVREVGRRRIKVTLNELLALKERYGMSIQALLRRMRDLDVIKESYYAEWCREISRRGWRKQEPFELRREEPRWLRQQASRAYAEGLITQDVLIRLLGSDGEWVLTSPSVMDPRALAELPLAERQKVLGSQAEAMVSHYEQDPGWRELEGGDLIVE